MRNKAIWITLGVIAVAIVAIVAFQQTRQPSKEEKVIKVGAILPLTGPASVAGQYVKEGLDLAIEEINRSSDINFTIIYEDSKSQPKDGVAAYNKMLMEDRPNVVIVALSSVAKALSSLASKNDTILICTAVAIPNISDGRFVFRIYPNTDGIAGVLADFCASNLRAKRAAVIYINDDFGRSCYEIFSKEFQRLGGQLVFVEAYEPTQTSFRSQIAKLQVIRPTPDVIYLNGYGPSYVAILKQLKESGIRSQVVGDLNLGLPATLEQAAEAAEGAYYVDGNLSLEFESAFLRKYGRKPTVISGYAYDILRILSSIAIQKDDFATNTIRDGLLRVKDYRGVTGAISIEPNGDSNLKFVVKRIVNGQPTLYR